MNVGHGRCRRQSCVYRYVASVASDHSEQLNESICIQTQRVPSDLKGKYITRLKSNDTYSCRIAQIAERFGSKFQYWTILQPGL